MIKKYLLIPLFFILTFLLILTPIIADSDIENTIDEKAKNIENTIENTENIIEIIEDPEDRDEYLKKEWIKILNKEPFKSTIETLHKTLISLNPVWENILGLSYSLSWVFVLTLITLITLILIDLDFATMISSDFPTKYKMYAKLGIAATSIIAIILIKIPKYLSILILKATSIINSWIIKAIILIAIIIFLPYSTKYFKQLKNTVIKKKKEKGMERTETKTKELSKETNAISKETKAIKEIVVPREEKNKQEDKDKERIKALEREAEDALGGLGTSED